MSSPAPRTRPVSSAQARASSEIMGPLPSLMMKGFFFIFEKASRSNICTLSSVRFMCMEMTSDSANIVSRSTSVAPAASAISGGRKGS